MAGTHRFTDPRHQKDITSYPCCQRIHDLEGCMPPQVLMLEPSLPPKIPKDQYEVDTNSNTVSAPRTSADGTHRPLRGIPGVAG